jgi:hypothetical protein
MRSLKNIRVYKMIVDQWESSCEPCEAADYFECWDDYDDDGEPIGESYCCFDDRGITADITDDELHEIAKQAVDIACEGGADISETIDDFLYGILDEKQLGRAMSDEA